MYIICNNQFSFPLEALPPPCPASCLSHVLGLLATFFPCTTEMSWKKAVDINGILCKLNLPTWQSMPYKKRKKHTKTKTWLSISKIIRKTS